MMMKKLFLSFVMMLMAATGAWAQEIDGINYSISTYYEYAEVTKPSEGVYSGAITIPDYVHYDDKDYPVTKIGMNAFENATITSIRLSSKLEEIGQYAFHGCTSLTSITLPEGLKNINPYAFSGSGITSVTVPGTVRSIGSAFSGCTQLTSITFAYSDNLTDDGWSSYGKGVLTSDGFDDSPITDVVVDRPWHPNNSSSSSKPIFEQAKRVTFGPHATTIPSGMFKNQTTLESLTIGANVTEIDGYYAFQNCQLPAGTTIPFTQFKKIGEYAFEGCTNIPTTLDLSAVEEIGSNAFKDCKSIQTLIIGGGTIGTYAFNGCENLSSITLKEGVTEIGQANFANLANLTTISLPSTLKKIGGEAFYYCENLTIPGGLPEGLEEIGTRAFYHCKKLNVKIPSTVTMIDQSAFTSCESLTELTIPAGVTSLNMYTFDGCTGLTKIVIPGTLKSIGSYDLDCPNVTDVTIEYGEEPISMNDVAFGLRPHITNVYIDRDFKWGYNRESMFADSENITFGPHVTAIPDKALYEMTNMKNVTMTDNVKKIGENAFYRAKSENLTLSKKIETIAENAFMAYTWFDKTFTFPITVKEIGKAAFGQFRSWGNTLENVYVPWLTPLAIEDDEPEEDTYGSNTRFAYDDNQTLWVPGGTMEAYKNASIWKKFKNFDYWSFVVKTSVAGKGQVTIKNGEAVTDNGTNTEKKAQNDQLVDAGAGAAVSGLFVREKDLVLTPKASRGYELSTLTANGTDIKAAGKVENLLADQTIVAKFTPIKYKITYKNLLNGTLPEGKENPATYTVEDGAITLVNPTRTGCNFKGWTGTDLTEATMTVTIPANSIGKREYTAVWEPIVYSITYDLAGGSVNPANKDKYTIETANFTLTNPTKTGYTFTGWTGTGLSDKTKTVTITQGSYGNRTYTATWIANTYKVNYDINGGDKGEMAEQGFVYDVAQNLTANAYTRTGYTFKGWNLQEDGQGTAYADKQEVKNLTAKNNEVVKLYAQWTPNTYKVHFDANGGTGTMNDQKHKYGTAKALTANAFTLAGYVFAGWNTKADGTGQSYADKKKVKNLTAEQDGIVNLYAQWKKSGDINGDGKADIADVVMLSNAILNGKTDSKFDVNGDGQVNAEDVTALANIIAGI